MWFSILKRIYPTYDEEEQIDYTDKFDEVGKDYYFTWEQGEAYCRFVIEYGDNLTILIFNVGDTNRGKRLGESFLKKFIKEAEEKFNRKFNILVQGPTDIALPFWKKMKRKGIILEWY